MAVAPEFSVRQLTADDSELLLNLARACPPLDVLTAYTYWMVSHLYSSTSYVLVDGATGRTAGYVMGLPGEDTMFCWQLGILPEFRGWGGSGLLFAALANRAVELELDKMEMSIGTRNEVSRSALASFVRDWGGTAEALRDIVVPERDDDESETLVVMHLTATAVA